MTPHLAVSSHPAHHPLDAPPHRRRRRRRLCPPRAARPSPSPSLRCRAAAASATAAVPQPPRAPEAAARTRVFVVSDLHTDYQENMDWVRRLAVGVGPPDAGGVNALVVAGDVAETRDNFARTMGALRDQFDAVFYVPGNHDLWLRREEDGRYMDSLEKLTALLDACSELGVDTGPKTIGDLGIIPLFSWYHKSFDKEKDLTSVRVPSLEMACKDFHACKWPSELGSDDEALALYFDQLNDKYNDAIEEVKKNSKQILTFSHFVPRQELCPEKRMLYYPNLPKVIGSDYLERRLRAIHNNAEGGAACHVFGHTHFCWDSMIDGIRYVQAPLAYPRERKRRMNGGEGWLPFCVYRDGFNPEIYPAIWSDYYNKNKREPENTQLAPWVAKYFRKYY
ncbi:acyl-carrier-protein phosphodiesterase PptH-like [Lolium rigidum]|uniref:acyl-carrier-protein phosphodiesterase PptH-like n=1 Tax=Lolium rigidum TaxID=89674 RepID=UPI001F5E2FB2|nr:acyl-carrier-protein phosphodiesterase PptH-like [Lolium rigidum]